MMAANTAIPTEEPLTEADGKAIEIIETVSEGDRVLVNDRVHPLIVKRVRSRYEGRKGFDWVELEGPCGGVYQLLHRQSKRRGESISLQRETGYNDDGLPTYDEIRLSRIELVDHHEFRIGQVFEVSEPIFDEYYYVLMGIPDSGCYDVKVVGIRVEDVRVKDTKETGFFAERAKEKIFDGVLQLVDDLGIDYSDDRGVHYDTGRDEEIRLSGPHKRGVNLRPIEDSGLEVVKWDTIPFGFEDRFTSGEESEEEEDERVMTDGGQVTAQSSITMVNGRELVHHDRDDNRGIYYPDCGQEVTAAKGTHPLPDHLEADRDYGWQCSACENMSPCGAPTENARPR